MERRFGFLILVFLILIGLDLEASETPGMNDLDQNPNCPDPYSLIGTRLTAVVDAHGFLKVGGVSYWHSNRTLAQLRKYAYRRGELDRTRLKGRRVLDLPTGEGAATRDLLAEGVETVGVDIAFSSATKPSNNLVQADWNHLPFEDGVFDTTIMNNGIFFYSRRYDDAALEAALSEALRVTSKSGGEILMTGVAEPLRLEKIATKLGLTFETPYKSEDPYSSQEVWTYHLKVPTGL